MYFNIILTIFVRLFQNKYCYFCRNFYKLNKYKIDESLYCSIVRLYGKFFDLPPLAAKIYGYLIFDFKGEGHSLDELVEIFSASKSSVSTSLNLLKSKQLILDISKLEQRKKYFVINQEYPKIRFNELVERLKEEKRILKSLSELSKDINPEISSRILNHQLLLEKNILNIENTISNL